MIPKTLNAPLNTDTLNIMKRSLPTTTIDKYMKVIDLRKAGLTFEEIAERVGYESRSGAKMAFDSAVKYWGHESVTELRVIENERVEDLWRRTYKMLEDPTLTLSESLRIMETALKVTESKRKLHGLDAPRQLEISGQDGDEIKTDVGQILKDRLQALHDRYVESTSEESEALTEAVETDQGINTAETPKNASESLKNASTEDNITDMEVDLAEKRSEIADRFEIVNGLKILRKNE